MGLDNGIVLKDTTRQNIETPWFVSFPFDNDYDNKLDVCYWRKCWGIRNEIKRILHLKDNEYKCKVEEDDIPAIIRILEKYLDKDYWDDNAESIWIYDEYKPHLIQQIKNLLWLREYLRTYKRAECYFYDSY
jgi:hypothetical protein